MRQSICLPLDRWLQLWEALRSQSALRPELDCFCCTHQTLSIEESHCTHSTLLVSHSVGRWAKFQTSVPSRPFKSMFDFSSKTSIKTVFTRLSSITLPRSAISAGSRPSEKELWMEASRKTFKSFKIVFWMAIRCWLWLVVYVRRFKLFKTKLIIEVLGKSSEPYWKTSTFLSLIGNTYQGWSWSMQYYQSAVCTVRYSSFTDIGPKVATLWDCSKEVPQVISTWEVLPCPGEHHHLEVK